MEDIKKLENEIIEMNQELKDWEDYNKIENDLLREDIKSKEKLLKEFKKIHKRFKATNSN